MDRKEELSGHIRTAHEVLNQQKEHLRRLLRTKGKITLRLQGASLPVLKRRFIFDLNKINETISEVKGAISWSLKTINELEIEYNSREDGLLTHNPFQKLSTVSV